MSGTKRGLDPEEEPMQGKRQPKPAKKLREIAEAAEKPVKKRGRGRPPKSSYVAEKGHQHGHSVNKTSEVMVLLSLFTQGLMHASVIFVTQPEVCSQRHSKIPVSEEFRMEIEGCGTQV